MKYKKKNYLFEKSLIKINKLTTGVGRRKWGGTKLERDDYSATSDHTRLRIRSARGYTQRRRFVMLLRNRVCLLSFIILCVTFNGRGSYAVF